MKQSETMTWVLRISKLIVFAAFIWTAYIMFRVGANRHDIIDILYAAALFIILNKLDTSE